MAEVTSGAAANRAGRRAATDHAIHELLRRRWSPYSFDASRGVSDDDLRSLFEAARWTMSSYNEQPWRYAVGVRERDPEGWQRILESLVPANQAWAQHAPVLALGVAERRFEKNGKENKAAQHDLGAASAQLTIEATARGIAVHQMTGIDPDRARAAFDIPDSMEALTALAIGYPGEPEGIDPEYAARDRRPRVRKTLDELLLYGEL